MALFFLCITVLALLPASNLAKFQIKSTMTKLVFCLFVCFFKLKDGLCQQMAFHAIMYGAWLLLAMWATFSYTVKINGNFFSRAFNVNVLMSLSLLLHKLWCPCETDGRSRLQRGASGSEEEEGHQRHGWFRDLLFSCFCVCLTDMFERLQKLFRLSQTALPSKVDAVCFLSVGGRQSQ